VSDVSEVERRPVSITDPAAVLAAIAEFDLKGRDEFLANYRFGKSLSYFLEHEGEKYDAKAVLGAAFAHQFPAERALSNKEFDGGMETERALTRLGFTVVREATRMIWGRAALNERVSRLGGGRVELDAMGRSRRSKPKKKPQLPKRRDGTICQPRTWSDWHGPQFGNERFRRCTECKTVEKRTQ